MKDFSFRRPSQPEDAPATQDASQQEDLTQKILSTFQPPQPQAAPAPETPAAPAPQPQPSRQPFRWIPKALAGITAASLLLSAAAVAVSWAVLTQEPPYDDTELRDQIAQLQQQLATAATMPEGYLELQDDQMRYLSQQLLDQRVRLAEVEQALPTGPDVDLPNTVLTSWSLTGVPDLAQDNMRVSFQCATVETVQEMTLSIYDATGKLQEALPCQGDGTFFSAETQLPLSGGSLFKLLMTYPDGSQDLMELKGHGLEEMDKALWPQLATTMKPVLFSNYTTERFWVGYDILHLSPSQYVPAQNACGWSRLSIVYLYNGEYVSTTNLSEVLPELDLTTQVLNFELPTQTFQMPDFQEGDVHQLYLDGMMMLDESSGYPFSIPLDTWVVENGELKLTR